MLIRPRIARGFTLVELMIGIAVLAILVMAAAPSLQLWIVNTRIRTAAEGMQNGLRLAQAEAARQNRQVVFSRVSATPAQDTPPDADGNNWSAQIVPIAGLDDDPARTRPDGSAAGVRQIFIRGGLMADVVSGVVIEAAPASSEDAPASICFSPSGVVVANPNPMPGAVCPGGPATYLINHPNGDRPLWVRVTVNGRVRMCDPAKTLNATNPDGCL